ncbi:TnsD family Tn7-like transposition protein [Vibrio sp. 10N.239.311.G01]|uniref:TnsD family Tn7-like transposition protein n=1 Tax=Vibrio sp. 10N.239.311.G01 TaxID=3229976 RepID=UPI00354DFB47
MGWCFFSKNAKFYLQQTEQASNYCNRESSKPRVCLSELTSGNSLRSVAKATGYSVGYLAALAQRNGIAVNHRFKRLSNSLVDMIIKLAFRGLHRRDIAKLCGVSVGTVEQKINSMSGLAAWRKRLWFCQKRNQYRQTLQSIISQNPTLTRTEIKHSSSCYMWLFRYDKDWLNQHLPKREPAKFHKSIDWNQVDKKLAKQIKQHVNKANSVSHVERQVNSRHSLIKNRKRLPLSIKQAEQIVEKSKN